MIHAGGTGPGARDAGCKELTVASPLARRRIWGGAMTDAIVVLVTAPTADKAAELARALVEEGQIGRAHV